MGKTNLTGALALTAVGSLLVTTQTFAESTCFEQGSCLSPTGWYVGGELGRSKSNFDNDELGRLIDASGLNVNSSSFDGDDGSLGAFLGYQMDEYIAFELGYRDLGDYSSVLGGLTDDPASFSQLANSIAPESGSGFTLGTVLSYPLDEQIKVAAKLGLWRWDADRDTNSTATALQTSDSGLDVYYGVEASYQIAQQWQAYVSAVNYKFDRDESTNLSLGIRYFFDGASQPKKAQARPAQPAVQQAVTKAPSDADGDGVLDGDDKCAATPMSHEVDRNGCTVYEEVQYQHQLVIYYPNNSYAVNSDYNSKIADLVDFAKNNGIRYLQVVGHTSTPGTEAYNQTLSVQRAESLKTILVKDHGYSASQIEAVGKGESSPAVAGNTEAAHSKNRRIEVNLSATGKKPKLR